ncbi:hypothetical protein ACHAXS_011496 [Conticribra weissflogii]
MWPFVLINWRLDDVTIILLMHICYHSTKAANAKNCVTPDFTRILTEDMKYYFMDHRKITKEKHHVPQLTIAGNTGKTMNPPNDAIHAPRGNQKDEGEQPQSTATEALNSAAILTEAWFNKSQESGTVHPPLNCTVDEDAAAPDVSVAALPAIPPDGNQVQDRNLDSRDEGKMIVEGVEQQQQHSQGADARADTSQVQLPLPAFAFPLKPSYASADITAASSTKRRSTSFEGSNNGDGDEEEVRQNQLHFTDYENSDTNKINITTNSNNLSSSKLQQQQLLEQQRKQTKLTPADHRVIISNALQITSHSERDAALLTALRGCAKELEEAEDDHDRATKRLKSAKEMFDWAAGALSGYAKDIEPKCEKLVKRGRKKKGEKKDEEEEKTDGVGGGGVIVGASLGGGTGVGTGDGVVGEEDLRRFVPPDEGPLLPPSLLPMKNQSAHFSFTAFD